MDKSEEANQTGLYPLPKNKQIEVVIMWLIGAITACVILYMIYTKFVVKKDIKEYLKHM